MCGINAIYGYRESAPPVDSDELIASRECMHARVMPALAKPVSNEFRHAAIEQNLHCQ